MKKPKLKFAPYKCCICKGPVEQWHRGSSGYGHNPAPLKHRGRCCGMCNDRLVVPTRIIMAFSQQLEEKNNDQ